MREEKRHSEGMAGLGFLSQAAATKQRDAALLILISSFNFKRIHGSSYPYTKSSCVITVRELSEIAPFIPTEQKLKTGVRPELNHFDPNFLFSCSTACTSSFLLVTFILHVLAMTWGQQCPLNHKVLCSFFHHLHSLLTVWRGNCFVN